MKPSSARVHRQFFGDRRGKVFVHCRWSRFGKILEIVLHHPAARLDIYSERIRDALNALGLHAKRSEGNLPLPRFPLHLEHHFWRGMFDGEGGFARDRSTKDPLSGYGVALSGTVAVVNAFGDYVAPVVDDGRRRLDSYNGLCPQNRKLQVSGLVGLILLRALYRDATVSLPRKNEVTADLLEQFAARLEDGGVYGIQGGRLCWLRSYEPCE